MQSSAEALVKELQGIIDKRSIHSAQPVSASTRQPSLIAQEDQRLKTALLGQDSCLISSTAMPSKGVEAAADRVHAGDIGDTAEVLKHMLSRMLEIFKVLQKKVQLCCLMQSFPT